MAEGQPSYVRVLPGGTEFAVAEGQSILGAAQAQSILWPTVCNGEGRCTQCFFEVVDGGENIVPPSDREHEVLDRIRWHGEPHPPERLACWARVTGNVVVRRRGVRRRDG